MGLDDYDDNDEREKQRLIDHVEKKPVCKEKLGYIGPKKDLE